MTIRARILEGLINGQKNRLAKLIEINAPQVMIDSQKESIAALEQGLMPKISDKHGVLDEEFVSQEALTGRGGKVYYKFNDDILFFPTARYGMFITREENLDSR